MSTLKVDSKLRIDFEKMNGINELLKVLSNPDRLKIVCTLIGQELNVQTIEKVTEIHQPTLSQQLTVLRKAEMVTTRRDGKQIFYSIADENTLILLQTLYKLYCV